VVQVVAGSAPWRLAARETRPEGTVVRVGDVALGSGDCVVIAGPCAVESEAQLLTTAHLVKQAGARLLRGGAFKPRTSPYSFEGLGLPGLRLLARARQETGLPIVTEALDEASLAQVEEVADLIQIGTRNMHNAGFSGAPPAPEAHPPQARHGGHPGGAPDGRGVRAGGGEPERGAVRAGDPHLLAA
jgi:3-deoxy-7-phosphoheptulonate synthase